MFVHVTVDVLQSYTTVNCFYPLNTNHTIVVTVFSMIMSVLFSLCVNTSVQCFSLRLVDTCNVQTT